MTDLAQGRRVGDHPPRWRWLFTPQATSLLLVVAILLLAFVTIQTNKAASASKQNTTVTRQIITRQNAESRQADLRAKEQAVETARLATETAAKLLAGVSASNKTRDAQAVTFGRQLEAELAASIERLNAALVQLQRSLDYYAAQDARRDRQNRQAAPSPSPTCLTLPVVGCRP